MTICYDAKVSGQSNETDEIVKSKISLMYTWSWLLNLLIYADNVLAVLWYNCSTSHPEQAISANFGNEIDSFILIDRLWSILTGAVLKEKKETRNTSRTQVFCSHSGLGFTPVTLIGQTLCMNSRL